jgi:hypothetical protein
MQHDDDASAAFRQTAPGADRRDARAASPCVKICTLDPTGAFCLGCGRTPAEIFAAGAHLERRAAR